MFAMSIMVTVSGIVLGATELIAANFSDVKEPVFVPVKGNQLPLTGYYEQSITNDGLDRTAMIYIPEKARMRKYFVVLALPSGQT